MDSSELDAGFVLFYTGARIIANKKALDNFVRYKSHRVPAISDGRSIAFPNRSACSKRSLLARDPRRTIKRRVAPITIAERLKRGGERERNYA